MPLELQPPGTPTRNPSLQPNGDHMPLTNDSASKMSTAQILRELLHGIQLPKTPKATTCTIPLVVLHWAQSLIDSIVNDIHLTSAVTLLASKIDSLEAQIDMSHRMAPLPCTHTCTATPTQNAMSHCNYATVASTPPPNCLKHQRPTCVVHQK
jgi:hypothetical protein